MGTGRFEAFSDGVITIIVPVTEQIDGAILWANLHLLFWLSLVPFVTAWMGENHFAAAAAAVWRRGAADGDRILDPAACDHQ